jgi:hypothetical protein
LRQPCPRIINRAECFKEASETRLGTLDVDDGAPSAATAELSYDNLDFMNAVQAFLGSLRGASVAALRRGFRSAGVEDNAFTLFPKLMDSASLFLSANSATVYFWGFVDLSDGPMAVDIPPLGPPTGILGTIDDMWFRWVTDFGLPGPDRAQGGRYLLAGPGYDGPLPDSGFHVFHVRTTRATVLGRAFMGQQRPEGPDRNRPRRRSRLSLRALARRGPRWRHSSQGGSAAWNTVGKPETHFVDCTGKSFNTIYPNDFSYWELVNELVQQEPPEAGDPELLGLLAAVGIVHGKKFEPDCVSGTGNRPKCSHCRSISG